MPSLALTPALREPARRLYALRTMLFEASRPVSEWLGKAKSTPVEWRADSLNALRAVAEPGMVVVGRRRGLGSNLFVPGYWKHAGIIAADANGAPTRVVEATIRSGVAYRDISDFVTDFDELAVIEPRLLPRSQWSQLVARAESRLGKPYDFTFVAADNGQYYCSKLIYWSLHEVLGRPPVRIRLHWGGYGLIPDDLVEDAEHFDVRLRLELNTPLLDPALQQRAA